MRISLKEETKMFAKNLPGLSGVIALAKRCIMRSYFAAAIMPLLLMTSMQTPGSPSTYTYIGNAVMQHANFEPTAGMIGNAPTQHWPGHDFGAIANESSLAEYLPAATPFYYTLYNGNIVKRNSEFGPLTGTVDYSLTTRGPGHDFGAIGGYK
jgi:hypothetical protein